MFSTVKSTKTHTPGGKHAGSDSWPPYTIPFSSRTTLKLWRSASGGGTEKSVAIAIGSSLSWFAVSVPFWSVSACASGGGNVSANSNTGVDCTGRHVTCCTHRGTCGDVGRPANANLSTTSRCKAKTRHQSRTGAPARSRKTHMQQKAPPVRAREMRRTCVKSSAAGCLSVSMSRAARTTFAVQCVVGMQG
jgi:hypothetical protein